MLIIVLSIIFSVVQPITVSAAAVNPVYPNVTGTVVGVYEGSHLNVRDDASMDATILFKLVNGDTFIVSGATPDGEWFFINTLDGKTGFANSEFIYVAVDAVSTRSSNTIYVGDTVQLITVITPWIATNKEVTWKSSDDTIATVSSNGLVTGKKAGTATITATSKDRNISDPCTIVVKNIPVTGISVTPDSASITMGDSVNLSAQISPSNATIKTHKWSSDNESVATVDSNGVVTSHSVGTAVITATADDNNITATSTITVDPVGITGITVTPSNTSMYVGTSKNIIAKVLPNDADQTVTWGSSDEGIATVDSNGRVTAHAVGSVMIIATTSNGMSDHCTIQVGDESVSSVSLTPKKIDIYKGETKTLEATIFPATASNKEVTWESDNTAVVTVDSVTGEITGISKGTAIITVKTEDGNFTDTCEVVVKEVPVDSVKILPANATVKVNEGILLNVVVEPVNAENKNVIWWSEDIAIAVVDQNGLAIGKKAGSTKIKVMTQDGGMVAECEVTVENIDVTSITLQPSSISIKSGNTYQLISNIAPSNATNQKLTWESEDETIAIVSDSGMVTGKNAGTVMVKAKTENGLEAICEVTVKKSNITISPIVYIGSTLQLKTIIEPADMTEVVTFRSDNEVIAKVNNDGLITGLSKGQTTIRAYDKDNDEIFSIMVTVILQVSSIVVNPTAKINVGNTVKINAVVSPSNASDTTVIWTSSDESIATVDSNGIVKGLADGKVTITARTVDGNKTASCEVTVIDPVTEITISATLEVGQILNVKVSNIGESERIEWATTDPMIVSVRSTGNITGQITAMKEGTAAVTAKINGVIIESFNIKVIKYPVTSVKINGNNLTLIKGTKSREMLATVYPANATNKNVVWSTSNSSIATVSNGVITGLKEGIVDIVATADGGETATCTTIVYTETASRRAIIKNATVKRDVPSIDYAVMGDLPAGTEIIILGTVNDWYFVAIPEICSAFVHSKYVDFNIPVTSVKINGDNLMVVKGTKSKTMLATVYPATANQTVTWGTSNSSIATVSGGVATGIKEGVMEMTATAGGKTGECTTIVYTPLATEREAIIKSATIRKDVPSTAYEQKNPVAIPTGTKIILKGTINDWYFVAIPNVCSTFVHSQYIDFNIPVTSIVTAESSTIYIGQTKKLGVTVYPTTATDQTLSWSSSKPSVASVDANGNIKGLSEGITIITITSRNGKSARCVYGVYKYSTGTGKVNATGVNVRELPSTDYKVQQVAKNGETLKILGVSNDWYFAIFENQNSGFISKQYVTTGSSSSGSSYTSRTGYAADSLNIREGASTGTKVITTVSKGTSLTIIGESGNWYQISYGGDTRYVSKDYVTFTKPSTNTPSIPAVAGSGSNYSSMYKVLGSPDGTVSFSFKNVTAPVASLERFVQIAESQIGYQSGEIDSVNKTVTFPYKDYNGWTVYGRWLNIGNSGQAAWCASFVSWCGDQAGFSVPKNANVLKTKKLYKDDSEYKTIAQVNDGEYIPKRGDSIFFNKSLDDNKAEGNHIGIVTSYNKSTKTIYYVDGNGSATGKVIKQTCVPEGKNWSKKVVGFGSN